MRYLTILFISVVYSTHAFSQEGFEGFIIEKYYETNTYDGADSNHVGTLPAGSVTYRIYLDLAPGYRFQAVYGTKESPIIISSTAPFYNHIENGQTHPNIIPDRSLGKNVALLDSWLSVGAAGENHLGIPKEFDPDGKDSLLQFTPGYFTNNQRHTISPMQSDGMVFSDNLPFPTFFQMDSALLVLGSSTKGQTIKIENGAWACLGKGSVGADSLTTNTVLLGQLTTTGDMTMSLNIMISNPQGKSIKYTYGQIASDSIHDDRLIIKSFRKRSKKRGRK
jgi:hypothetical protein